MNRTLSAVVVVLGVLFSHPGSFASFHLWDINEIFSNSDGTIQFIELSTTSATEQQLGGHTIVSSGPGVPTQQFTFDSDLTGSTSDKTVLLATQRFANLTGLAPDYMIPDSFIPIGGGTLNFGENSDVFDINREQLPRNGQQSLNSADQAQDATPTRFDGLSAQMPAQANPFASFDASTSILNVPELNAPGIGIANVNFSVNLATLEFGVLDFFLYGAGITPGDRAAFFNGTSLHIPALVFNNETYEVNLFPVSDDPIILGNPEILSVVPVQPDPDPMPQPDLLQESIDRGQLQYSQLCAACHGVDGSGGSGPNLRTSSLNTFDSLRNTIEFTMPRNNSGACRDTDTSSCATDIANFVLFEFQGLPR